MTITVLAQKGEQAKSHTTVNLAADLQLRGLGGVVVDLDSQQRDATKYARALPAFAFHTSLPSQKADGFTLVDTSPTLDPHIIHAIERSDLVLIPVTPFLESIDALARTFETIDMVMAQHPNLIARVLFTKMSTKSVPAAIYGTARALGAWPTLQTTIPTRPNDFLKSAASRVPVVLRSPKSAAACAYHEAVDELFGVLDYAAPSAQS